MFKPLILDIMEWKDKQKNSKMPEQPQSIAVDNRDPPINREKTCPLLPRVFYNTGRHHTMSEYSRGNAPATEFQIYTWMDARELTVLSFKEDLMNRAVLILTDNISTASTRTSGTLGVQAQASQVW